MDIVFKSGEFYEAAGNSWTPIVGLVGVVVGALLKWGIDYFNETKKEKKRINELTKFLKITLEHLTIKIDNQISHFNDYIKTFNERALKDREFQFSESLKTEHLFKTITYTELNGIISKKGSYQEYLNLLDSVDKLNFISNQYQIVLKDYHEDYLEIFDSLEKQTEEFIKYVNGLHNIRNSDGSKNEIIKLFDERIGLWLEAIKLNNRSDPYYFYDLIITPIFELILEIRPNNEMISNVGALCIEFGKKISHYDSLRKNSINSIEDLKNGFEVVKSNFSNTLILIK